MGWIDFAKTARDRLVDVTLPRPVVFHHVPKCGGTSVGRALRTRYLLSQATVKPETAFRAFETFSGRSDREQMLIDVLDLQEQMFLYLLFEGVRCISAHVRFSPRAHARFSDRYAFITILREPTERFISHYFWSHGKPNAHARIEENFASFLDTPRARRLGSTYVEFFSGLPKDADFTSQAAISAAIDNLRKFDVVGRLEDLTGFRRQVHAKVGARLQIGHENRMRQPRGHREQTASTDLRQRVAALCGPDLDVWNAVTGRG